MARIIRKCVLDETPQGNNVFRIHRGRIMGNPYTHIRNKKTKAAVVVGTREEAVEMFSHYFDNMLTDESPTGKRFRKEWDRMYETYLNSDEIYLCCYCKENEACHADVIAKKLVQRSMKDKLDYLRRRRDEELETLM